MLTNQEKKTLSELYDYTCKSFDKSLEPEVLRLQIEDLSDLSFIDIKNALNEYRKNPKNNFWPKANKIREIISPVQSVDTIANEVASRIRNAISKYGWCNANDAKNFIGELGWKVVERSGGWNYICENHGLDLNPLTFHAQSRDLAKSLYESKKLGLDDIAIGLPNSESKKEIDFFVKELSNTKSIDFIK